MAKKKSDAPTDGHKAVTYMAIPRPWFLALAAVLIVTWFGLIAVWMRAESPVHGESAGAAAATAARVGKWGNLKLFPIVISPPMELVVTDFGFMPGPTWYFPGANADAASRMLLASGVSAPDAARICAAAQPEPRISGVILRPDPAWVRALDRQTRARIYGMLAKTELNTDQAQAFRYRGDNLEEWLAPDLISPRLRQIVEPLVYREGNYMLFSDIELVRAEVGGEDEMRQLSKTLFRQPTFLARLSVDSTAGLDALVEYWGRGGRRTQIRPLLESVAADRSDQSIDVTYLLPPFARNHLYHYPELSAADLDRPMVVNCLWTALNFFQPEPDDRFLDVATALRTLKEDYFVVESDFELGDIVAFLDEKGNIFHAAVYVADNLVFGKNGISAMAPWTILPLEDVKGYYRWRSENPRLIVHRRKGF